MIAQKRAFIKAVRMVTGATEFFTQDLDDKYDDLGEVVEGAYHVIGDPETKTETREEGAERLAQELLAVRPGGEKPYFANKGQIVAAFNALALKYTLEQHAELKQRLIEYVTS